MKEEHYQEMSDFEKKYWWHVGRRAIFFGLLNKYFSIARQKRILDFGCGTGGNYELLNKYGEVIGVDNSQDALDHYCKKDQNLILMKTSKIPLEDRFVDVVTAFDVLEHIENDNETVKEFYRVLKEGGKVFITVPAYNFLWSDHDEILGHYRRYGATDLKNKFEKEGFKMSKISYVVCLIFPLIFVYRIYRKVIKNKKKKTSYVLFPKFINDIFIIIMKIEAKFIRRINLPFGCSVVAIFEKK